MSKFRTSISKSSYPFGFEHIHPVLCIGSCFTENIGQKLQNHHFPTLINPFGILYNPYSIGNTLEYLFKGQAFSKENLFTGNGLWHSFDHHGYFSNPDQSAALQNINESLQKGSAFLKTTKRLALTFGTSKVFVYKKTQQIVANCHKIPNHQFERRTLSIDTIIKKLGPLFQQLKTNNPELEILLTVSPVRHIRDGLVENQRSKAQLLLASEELSHAFDFVHYFPSYEIMMDDLRDYRFYQADLIHPSEVAIDYIWEHFSQCFFNEETIDLNSKISKIVLAANHRPFHPESPAHQDFIAKQIQLIEILKKNHGFLNFEKELQTLTAQLI